MRNRNCNDGTCNIKYIDMKSNFDATLRTINSKSGFPIFIDYSMKLLRKNLTKGGICSKWNWNVPNNEYNYLLLNYVHNYPNNKIYN